MPRMTREEMLYWLEPLTAFYTLKKTAEEINSTVITLTRWLENQGTPDISWRNKFTVAQRRLIKLLRKKESQFTTHIADWLESVPPPTLNTIGRLDDTWLREFIIAKVS